MSSELQLLKMLEPSIRPTGSPSPSAKPCVPIEQRDFEQLLASAQAEASQRPLRFSAHAQQCLEQQKIELTESQTNALNNAAAKAELKGAKNAFMQMDSLGLIVNLPNRTVLTVLPEDRMRDGIVTQIDSAVIVDESQANQPPTRLNLNSYTRGLTQ